MRLALQRGVGDCGIACVATLLEQSYEDVYVKAAALEPVFRGKCGVHFPTLVALAKSCGCDLREKSAPADDDEGVLTVRWKRGSRHYRGSLFRQHLVVYGHGIVVDPADGLILPVDDYLARERAAAGVFLEWR